MGHVQVLHVGLRLVQALEGLMIEVDRMFCTQALKDLFTQLQS